MRARFWWRDLRGRDDSEDLGVDGRIILKYTFRTDLSG